VGDAAAATDLARGAVATDEDAPAVTDAVADLSTVALAVRAFAGDWHSFDVAADVPLGITGVERSPAAIAAVERAAAPVADQAAGAIPLAASRGQFVATRAGGRAANP
jgi:hypothetical protein